MVLIKTEGRTHRPSKLLLWVRTGDFGLGRGHPFFFGAERERERGLGFCDHAQGGAEGHEDEDPFKKIL